MMVIRNEWGPRQSLQRVLYHRSSYLQEKGYVSLTGITFFLYFRHVRYNYTKRGDNLYLDRYRTGGIRMKALYPTPVSAFVCETPSMTAAVELTRAVCCRGILCQKRTIYPLPNGKALLRLDYLRLYWLKNTLPLCNSGSTAKRCFSLPPFLPLFSFAIKRPAAPAGFFFIW